LIRRNACDFDLDRGGTTMIRTLTIDNDTRNLQDLSGRLLKARLSSGQTASAIEALQALNPGVNLEQLTAGTVLFVPDTPSFKVSASDSVPGKPLDDLQQLMRQALDAAAKDLKAGNAARAAERADVIAAMKIDSVARILASDAELKQLAADATKAFTDDQQQADQAEQALAAASNAALAKLAELSKLLG
jgi:hypothetical protein